MRPGYGGKAEGGNGRGDDESEEGFTSMTGSVSMIAMVCCSSQSRDEQEDGRRYPCLHNNSEYGEYTELIQCLGQHRKDRRETVSSATAALLVIKPINADLRPTTGLYGMDESRFQDIQQLVCASGRPAEYS